VAGKRQERPRRQLRALLRRGVPAAEQESAARAEFWEVAREMTPYVALEHAGEVFVLPTSIDPKLFVRAGRSDFVVLERACTLLGNGGRLAGGETFVDVGAHIGTTTVSALARHGFGRAVSIEPDPDHLPLLRANVSLNDLDDRVTVIAAGISDTSREQSFVQGSRKEESYRWMKGRLVDSTSPEAVTVETVTLDGLVQAGIVDPSTAGLVWFDCGRCEEAALRAGASFLDRRVPLVFTLRRRQFTDPSPVRSRLEEMYEHVVDLRSPNLADPITSWEPVFRPVRDLGAIPSDRKMTDVLLL
jgi:FkbM family methyltransferase